MKRFLLLCLSFAIMLGVASCNSPQSAIRDLEVLLSEIEANHQTYTEEDWENVSLAYSEIEERLATYQFTDEELKEIGRLKGKCMAYLAKQSVNDFGQQLMDLAKELEGGIEGFLDVLTNENNQ